MMYLAGVKQPYRFVIKLSLLNNLNGKIKVSAHLSKYDTNSFINYNLRLTIFSQHCQIDARVTELDERRAT